MNRQPPKAARPNGAPQPRPTTATDPRGDPNRTPDAAPSTTHDQDAVRAQLQARARELGAELRQAEAERADSLTPSPADAVQDSGDQGEQRAREIVLSAEEARDAVELEQIDAAMQRLADGSYGICIDCDVEIPAARLKVQPAAARCIDCQERFEQTQALQAPGMQIV